MPRNVVQRTFPEGLHIPIENGGAELCGGVVERNAEEGVTWISSSSRRTRRARSASMTRPRPRQFARRPPATSSPSTVSPRCAYSTPTSIQVRWRDAQMRKIRSRLSSAHWSQ